MSAEDQPAHVVATAGHVDHGKSSLIVRLTGIDPDRWAEEKRRGLTIDLGFAWATLPSGREVGFVDVPGHERFIRNMLAGVGPVRLVLFVVAADERWKPQSEEHLEILDVLGAAGGVVALSKIDLVDSEAASEARRDVQDRLAGTVLADAPIVPCSAATGTGLDELVSALDDLVAAAPAPRTDALARLAIDRSFTIRGSGTVVTGTLTGGLLRSGDEVRIYPDGSRARIRSLQTHRRSVEVARPVSRVAVNLAGVAKDEVERGDVLAEPGRWRPTSVLDARLVGVRSLRDAVRSRGSFKLYVGSAERDVRIRFYDEEELRAGGSTFARIVLTAPVVVAYGDRFVLRETGRRTTVAGGIVLDAHPPVRAGGEARARLLRREVAGEDGLAPIIVEERGAVRTSELAIVIGGSPDLVEGAARVGSWWIARREMEELERAVREVLSAFHRERPLQRAVDVSDVRAGVMARASARLLPALEQGLLADALSAIERSGAVVREGTTLRLPEHRVRVPDREAAALVRTIGEAEPTPPTVRELVDGGTDGELVDACVSAGLLVRISDDLVVTRAFAARAEEVARDEAASAAGVTVSRFRELLGTTRKYALPILEWLDANGVTRRDGDVRRPA